MAKPLRLPIIAFLLLAAVAQDKPAEPKFSSKASYVLLPVLVTDSKGHPIYGLKSADFSIAVDREIQAIASFEEPVLTATGKLRPPVKDSSATEFSNLDISPPARHLTIIALDPLNTPLQERKPTTDAVISYLSRVQTGEPIELVWFNHRRIQVIHRFTSDYQSLVDSLRLTTFPADINFSIPIDTSNRTAVSKGRVTSTQKELEDRERQMQRQVEQENADMTADTLADAAAIFGSIPGSKTLLWVSRGFRLRLDQLVLSDGSILANSGRGLAREHWDAAFRQLANANIAVYPIDSRGLVAPNDLSDKSDVDSNVAGDRPGDKSAAQVKANQEFVTAARWVADETGGIAFTGSNGFEDELNRATEDANGTYMLSFRVPPGAKPGWHPIKVSVQHKGVNIITRPGFWLEKKPRPSTETIEAALTSPFPFTGLPVMVRWTDLKPSAKGKSQIGFQVAVPSGMPTSPDFSQHRVSIQVRAAVFDSNQKPVAGTKRDIVMDLDDAALEKLLRSAVSYKGVLELPTGEYEVAFAVKDNISGRVGSVIAPLTVK